MAAYADVNYLPYSNFLDSAESKNSGENVSEILNQYKKIVSIGIEALDKIQKGQIPDPTVGENACQIRAALFAECLNEPDFQGIINATKEHLIAAEAKLEGVAGPADRRGKTTLNHFLQETGNAIVIDSRIFDLITAHLLTLCREPKRCFVRQNETIWPEEKINETEGIRGISKPTVKKIDKFARKHLSAVSVSYLQRSAERNPLGASAIQVLTTKVKETKLHYKTAPCFSGTKALLAQAHAKGIPFVLNIHRVNPDTMEDLGVETFCYVSDGKHYQPSDSISKPAYIAADALSAANPPLSREALKEKLDRHEIGETLLAFMATHPSYGGDQKLEPAPEEEAEEIAQYGQKAFEWGLHPDKPEVCRFYHIYPEARSRYADFTH